MLIRLLKRDLRLCFYNRLSALNILLFFLIIISIFPLAIPPDFKELHFIGPGVIWVCALLVMLLSMDHFFKEDHQDGSLDSILLMPGSLVYYVVSKVIVHWLWLGLPIILLTPFLGLLYQLSMHTIIILMLGLLIGTPSLLLIGSVLSALTLTVHHSNILILLMALPLYTPILIFGAAASFVIAPWPIAAFEFLGSITALTITLLPMATVKILKYSIHY